MPLLFCTPVDQMHVSISKTNTTKLDPIERRTVKQGADHTILTQYLIKKRLYTCNAGESNFKITVKKIPRVEKDV